MYHRAVGMGNLSTATAGKNCDGRGEETCVELELAAMVSSSKTRPFPPSCGHWAWPECTCAGFGSARVVRRRARASAVHGRRPGAAPGYAPHCPIFAKSKCDFSSFALSGDRARNSKHRNHDRTRQKWGFCTVTRCILRSNFASDLEWGRHSMRKALWAKSRELVAGFNAPLQKAD